MDLKKIKPYKNQVLVKRIEYEEKVGNVIIPGIFDSKFYEVLAVGPREDAKGRELPPEMFIGQTVLIETFDGMFVDSLNHPLVKLVNQAQVMGVVETQITKHFEEGGLGDTR